MARIILGVKHFSASTIFGTIYVWCKQYLYVVSYAAPSTLCVWPVCVAYMTLAEDYLQCQPPLPTDISGLASDTRTAGWQPMQPKMGDCKAHVASGEGRHLQGTLPVAE